MDSTPRWIEDLTRLLPIRSQFVVAGNIRDSFLTPLEQAYDPRAAAALPVGASGGARLSLPAGVRPGRRPAPLPERARRGRARDEALRSQARRRRDADEPREPGRRDAQGRGAARGALRAGGRLRLAPDTAARSSRRRRASLLRRGRAHFARRASDRAEGRRHRHASTARRASTPCCGSSTAAQDLPSWLDARLHARVGAVARLARLRDAARAAQYLGNLFAGYEQGADDARTRSRSDFAQRTDGLPLVALADIAQLADRQGIGFRDVDDAVQLLQGRRHSTTRGRRTTCASASPRRCRSSRSA